MVYMARPNDDAVRLSISGADMEFELDLPMAGSAVAAGFPSPAGDYQGMKINLNSELVRNPASTFFARVSGVSMVDSGIDDGDLLVIDKSLEPTNGAVAICYVDGEFTLKRLSVTSEGLFLMPANENYQPIKIHPEEDFRVWGIVTYVIKSLR